MQIDIIRSSMLELSTKYLESCPSLLRRHSNSSDFDVVLFMRLSGDLMDTITKINSIQDFKQFYETLNCITQEELVIILKKNGIRYETL